MNSRRIRTGTGYLAANPRPVPAKRSGRCAYIPAEDFADDSGIDRNVIADEDRFR
ncbi:MAG: hypothetical protein IPI01_16620 [Ignavibacteriae bacterium]|nr:hypothetical protein [Ignavibacteriota bacterium]